MKIILKIVLPLILLVACQGKKTANEGNATDLPDSIDYALTDNEPEYDTYTDERDSLMNIFVNKEAVILLLNKEKQMREALVHQLKNMTPEQADTLFRSKSYFFGTTPEFTALAEELDPMITRIVNFNEILPSDSTILKLLKQSGCVINDIGEGMVEPDTDPYYYYHIFKPYITPETEHFARLKANTNTLIYADAALVVELDTLYDWCLKWEEFITAHPTTVYRSEVSENYKAYISSMLFCNMDNSNVFEYDDNGDRIGFRPFLLSNVRKLKKTGKGTKTHAIILKFLTTLNEQQYKYTKGMEERIMEAANWINN